MWRKLKTFPLRSETRQGCHFSQILSNALLEVLTIASDRKRNKMNSDWKGRSKSVTVCVDNTNLLNSFIVSSIMVCADF